MAKTHNDEVYERGDHDGRKDSGLANWVQQFSIPLDKDDEIYNKGYEHGAEHKPDSSSESSESSSGGSSSSSGGCYLTTACVNAMGLSDNCLELNLLRNFRDRILMPTSKGRQAVREYCRIAPKIVQAVNEQEDAQNIWRDTYRDIRRAVSLILSGDFEEAFEHYKRMTSKLQSKYLN